MKITKELIKERFEEYNQKYFNKQLGRCNFYLLPKNKSILGKYNGREDKKGTPIDRIGIGTNVIWTEDAFKHVLIHEMVHMYNRRIDNCVWDGVLGHGRHFRRQCRRLKREFGIDVLTLPDVEYIKKEFSPKLWERIILWLIDR